MARRRKAEKVPPVPDPRHNSELVAHLINHVMRCGKKSVAEGIVYSALDHIKGKVQGDPLEVLVRAIDNVKPRVEVSQGRQLALALRWVIQFSKARRGVPMRDALAMELLDAYTVSYTHLTLPTN